MTNLKVTDLWIYPIKSLAGIQLKDVNIESRGLQYDRRWVLVDENGDFVHQRDFPEMNFLQPEINGGLMTIRHIKGEYEDLTFNINEPDTEEVEHVLIWDDTCQGKPVDKKADLWFSNVLGKSMRLLFMHEDSIRQADQRYAINESDKVSFADGYPILMISEESLALLNSKTEEHIPMNRFRANVIVSGQSAHIEDQLRKININGLDLYGVKPCARCIMITIDIETLKKGKEPLKTLSTYRKLGNKILFGENFIPMGHGKISIGQDIEVLENKESIRF